MKIHGDFSINTGGLRSEGDCTIFELVSTTEKLTWFGLPDGNLHLQGGNMVVCDGDVVGMKIIGEKDVSITGPTGKLSIDGTANLRSENGNVVGIWIESVTEGISLTEVYYYSCYYYSCYYSDYYFIHSFIHLLIIFLTVISFFSIISRGTRAPCTTQLRTPPLFSSMLQHPTKKLSPTIPMIVMLMAGSLILQKIFFESYSYPLYIC